MDENRRESPGVTIPPPFIFVGFFAVGLALDRLVPLPAVKSSLATSLGGAFVVAALVVAVLGFKEFLGARTTVRPDREVTTLITGGIFAFSRNPLYLALLMFYLGMGLLLRHWWPVILAWPLVVAMNRFVIAREEQHLAARFGEAYADYCRRVRRWV